MARLVAGRMLTPRVRELVLERVDGAPFRFEPGQWVSLRLPLLDDHHRPLRRSYSLASVPDGTGRFELVVSRVEGGRSSQWLHEAPEGTQLEVKGPQGQFLFAPEPSPSLLVATGTGVAPFRGMVRLALAAGGDEPLWLLAGFRTLDEALYREELEALSRGHPRFRLELSLSRPGQGWGGRTGYVQGHVAELWRELSRFGRAQAYVCGVKKMLGEVREVLRGQLGVERQRVHLESYG